ncbi:Ankyrin repeat-containing protein family [Quillaja saponaria]|uniref:Ankyrin repeat-containing protein family n=1 Tax=Quillaja saponaria TaxID=32244 RepID=A0AAD7Q9S3_QUISA|nr:Ankyrin repeat-containing protein family [Quillaja saponaria]
MDPNTTLASSKWNRSDIKQNLYHFALKSVWQEVTEIYKKHSWTHTSVITRLGDTALHVAVVDGKYPFVKQLVEVIKHYGQVNAKKALGIQNERGNTPLHFAASRGYVEMCKCIAQEDPSLVGSRNKEGETPLFLAALHGHKDAFLFLHNIFPNPNKSIEHCRRNGGESILHCTIQREYFDLAIHIIYLYEELVNLVDEKGVTPLHVLASKPSAFRSGSHFQWWTTVIYHCIIVDPLKVQIQPDAQTSKMGPINDEKKNNFPENYYTCFGFFQMMSTFFQVVTQGKYVTTEDAGADTENQVAVGGRGHQAPTYQNLPQNYATCYELVKSAYMEIVGLTWVWKFRKGKPKLQPILEAAKNGVTEMVDRILDQFPVSIHDTTGDNKNILLVAVENRQPRIFEILKKKNLLTNLIQAVDKNDNTVLHFAAMLSKYKPWQIPGSALQMQWEIKWYEFVKGYVPQHFLFQNNKDNKNPGDIFAEDHIGLVKEGGEWLKSTSESCSLVAALIATVAFATSSTIPGGIEEKTGRPNLEGQPAFNIFAITSLVALCFSVTALIMFLAILTSRYQPKDFYKDLPWKLLVGLSSLFVSIATMLVAFCAAHFFVLKDNRLRHAAFPLYAVTCLPVTFYAVAQFPLYFDLLKANFKKVPQPSYKMVDF